LKAVRQKGKPIKIAVHYSTENLTARKALSDLFQSLKEKKFSPRIFYQAKLSFKIDGRIKVSHDKQNLKQYMSTTLQKILKGILHTEDENKQLQKDEKY
jgi:hypothetical protein